VGEVDPTTIMLLTPSGFFSETCLECQANVGEFYSDVLVGTLVWNSRPLGFIRH